jgi:hypothetical protein
MVRLDDIVDALDFQSDEQSAYLDRETGEVCVISREVMHMARAGGSPDRLPEWQKPEFEWAKLVVETGRMIRLPSQFDIDEGEIVAEFARSFPDARVRDELSDALHAKGAFSRFKRAVHQLGIQDAWYKHREDALREVAREWCEENSIPYSDT